MDRDRGRPAVRCNGDGADPDPRPQALRIAVVRAVAAAATMARSSRHSTSITMGITAFQTRVIVPRKGGGRSPIVAD